MFSVCCLPKTVIVSRARLVSHLARFTSIFYAQHSDLFLSACPLRNGPTPAPRQPDSRLAILPNSLHSQRQDKQQNIICNVVVKKGVEEPSLARFIDLLGYREITLRERHGTSNHCVQESCGRNVHSKSHHRGRSERRRRIERAHRETQ